MILIFAKVISMGTVSLEARVTLDINRKFAVISTNIRKNIENKLNKIFILLDEKDRKNADLEASV